MADDIYLDIFEEFKHMCPYSVDKIEKWYPHGELSIIIELADGGAYLYDSIMGSFRYASSLEKLLQAPEDEEKWRIAFSLRLYRTMRMRGFTQDELAWRVGVSVGSMSNYVNGVRVPSIYTIRKIAKELKCSVDELINF